MSRLTALVLLALSPAVFAQETKKPEAAAPAVAKIYLLKDARVVVRDDRRPAILPLP